MKRRANSLKRFQTIGVGKFAQVVCQVWTYPNQIIAIIDDGTIREIRAFSPHDVVR